MAMNWDILKARYLRESQVAQIDNLAWNFLRLQVLADSGTDELVAQHLVRESQFFIEWAVPNLDFDTEMTFVTELVDLQRLLSRWKLSWEELWENEQDRRAISAIAQHWCEHLQQKSDAIAS
ncbi:MAG: hypothetical protein ABG776_20255 [Cyanobacteria bacterium J06555_13]